MIPPLKIKSICLLIGLLANVALSAAENSYLFVTFKGEKSPMTEQVYFGLSKDGRQWQALNGGEFKPGPDFSFPFLFRHGSILPVSAAESDRLQAAFAKPAPTEATAPKPILDGFTADPAIRVFGDTYYVYPTSDKPNWLTTDFSVWSSKNLVDWKKEGMILDVTKDLSWGKIKAWAPDCIERDGKFFFYFCAEMKIGVAVSDKPTGPFKDALNRPLLQRGGKVRVATIDPYPFIDNDGQAYLFYGNGRFAQAVRLKPDMITTDGDPVDIPLKDFREGIVVFKRAGKYYFMWSIGDARSPDYRVGWGISDSPLGPVKIPDKDFIVLQKQGASLGTAHHSVVNVPGTDRWYVAYHRHAIPNGSGYKRETCLVRMEFNPDGSIQPMNPLTKTFRPGDAGEPIPPTPNVDLKTMTRFQYLLPIMLIGIAGTLTVTVENFGLKTSPACTLKVSLSGKGIEPATFTSPLPSLEPYAATQVSLKIDPNISLGKDIQVETTVGQPDAASIITT